jgi:hypothetical protein
MTPTSANRPSTASLLACGHVSGEDTDVTRDLEKSVARLFDADRTPPPDLETSLGFEIRSTASGVDSECRTDATPGGAHPQRRNTAAAFFGAANDFALVESAENDPKVTGRSRK